MRFVATSESRDSIQCIANCFGGPFEPWRADERCAKGHLEIVTDYCATLCRIQPPSTVHEHTWIANKLQFKGQHQMRSTGRRRWRWKRRSAALLNTITDIYGTIEMNFHFEIYAFCAFNMQINYSHRFVSTLRCCRSSRARGYCSARNATSTLHYWHEISLVLVLIWREWVCVCVCSAVGIFKRDRPNQKYRMNPTTECISREWWIDDEMRVV